MDLSRVARAVAVPVLAVSLAACGSDAPAGDATGDHLEPTFEAAPGKDGRNAGKKATDRRSAPSRPGAGGKATRPKEQTGRGGSSTGTDPVADAGSGSDGGSGGSGGSGGGAASGGSGGGAPGTSGPLRATVADGRGDVGGSLTTVPAYVDVVGAALVREAGGWTLTVDVAAAVPSRAEGERTMNVVGYVDIDRDGSIDYEVLGHLSDSGWSGSYRSPEGARFGRDSGVAVSAQGSSVVLRFPLGHLASAKRLQWAVASEYGSYEQVATGTTATDHAPDSGAVSFPG